VFVLVVPGSVFVLPLWWWLSRQRARLTRGAH